MYCQVIKPYDLVNQETRRLAFIDEDLRQTPRDTSMTNVFTMASCKYSRLIKWNGRGTMPDAEKQLLQAYVNVAHEHGKQVRLWSSPENEEVWQQLLNCGVDLINTDKLVLLKNFLLARTTIFANTDKLLLAKY